MRAPRFLVSRLALTLSILGSTGCGGAAVLWSAISGDPLIKLAFHPGASALDPRGIESASADWNGVTDVPDRARALADELALHGDGRGPEVVALHRLTGIGGLVGNDALDMILAALEARGLGYELAAVEDGLGAAAPGGRAGARLADLSLAASDVLLVRSDILWRNAVGGRIETSAPADGSGRPACWVGCDLLLGDDLVRVVASGPVGDVEADVSVTYAPGD